MSRRKDPKTKHISKSFFPNFFTKTCFGCGDLIHWEYLFSWLSGPLINGSGHFKYACMLCCKTKEDVVKLIDSKRKEAIEKRPDARTCSYRPPVQ